MTTPEHYQRLEQLFRLACTTPAEERSAMLDRLCAAEPALRGELEAMLKSDENPLSLFDHPLFHVVDRLTGNGSRVSLRTPASEPTPVVNASSSEKHALPRGRGHYQLLGEIARGGMGVVLRGHDSDLGRDIALKVLHKDLTGRPDVLQRFVEEAQIGGQLQHPGIVPVYELGLMADQRPYFTMKLVKGRTLAALLASRGPDDRHKLLVVFVSVCQTMAYAHSRGVIHRDLKPANVMVGAFGEVQVVDWGLAKVLASGGTADEKRQRQAQSNLSIIETVRREGSGDGSHSRVGSVMGTPAYMPPEQALGEVELLDERSDVFSLGAILCEILTGKPPYTGESQSTLQQAKLAQLESAWLRLNDCQADAELITLCKQCLAPEQAVRPRSAEVLAAALQAYLSSLDLRARAAQIEAAEARVKAAEERRARKLTLGLAASVLLTLLVAGGGWIAMDQQRAARQRQTNTQVGAALERATLFRGQQKWSNALGAAERAQQLAASPDASPELVAEVATDVEALRREAGEALRVEQQARENGELLSALDDVREPEGTALYYADWARVDRDYAAQCGRLGLDLDRPSTDEVARQLIARGLKAGFATILDEWSMVRTSAGNLEGARKLHDIAQVIDRDERCDAIFAAIQARDVPALEQVAQAADLGTLSGGALRLLGSGLQLLNANEEAIRVLAAAVDRFPSDFALRMEFAQSLANRASRWQESIQQYTAAIALRPGSIEAWHEKGRILVTWGEYAQGEAVLRQAIERWPRDSHLRIHLARAYRAGGAWDDAVRCLEQAFAIEDDDSGSRAQATIILAQLSEANSNAGHTELALEQQRSVVERMRQSESKPEELEAEKQRLANYLIDCGRAVEALPLAREALEVFRSTLPANHHNVLAAETTLAQALADLGEYEEAVALLRGVLDRAEDAEKPMHMARLAACLLLQDKGAEAEPLARECLAIRELTMAGSWQWLSARSMVGDALREQGRLEEAEPLLREAAEQMPDVPATRPRALPAAYQRLVRLYETQGRAAEAETWRARLEALSRR